MLGMAADRTVRVRSRTPGAFRRTPKRGTASGERHPERRWATCSRSPRRPPRSSATSSDDTDLGVSLELSLVEQPETFDETVEQDGAVVYLDPAASQLLDDKLLDAEVERDGVSFALVDNPLHQPPPSSNGTGG
jgi:hypothetical protein